MLERLRSLTSWAGAAARFAPAELDFGEAIAILIVMIGLISFASAGVWTVP